MPLDLRARIVSDNLYVWLDRKALSIKYGLTDEEIAFVGKMIKPMKWGNNGNDQ